MPQTKRDAKQEISFYSYASIFVSLFLKTLKEMSTDYVDIIGRTAKDYEIRKFLTNFAHTFYIEHLQKTVYGDFPNPEILKDMNKEESQIEVIKSFILPLAQEGEKNAIELLLAFAIFSENEIKKEARKRLVDCGKNKKSAEPVLSEISRLFAYDQDPTLIYVISEFNLAFAIENARTWNHIGNNRQKVCAIEIFANNLNASKDYIKYFLEKNSLHQMKEERSLFKLRQAFYKIVLFGFQNELIKKEVALNYLSNVYAFEDVPSSINFLSDIIRKIDENNSAKNISELFIRLSSNNTLFGVYSDGVEKCFEKLDVKQKTIFLGKFLSSAFSTEAIGWAIRTMKSNCHIDMVHSILQDAVENNPNKENFAHALFSISKKDGKVSKKWFVCLTENLFDRILEELKSSKNKNEVLGISTLFAFNGTPSQKENALECLFDYLEKDPRLKNDDLNKLIHIIFVISSSSDKLRKISTEGLLLEINDSKNLKENVFQICSNTLSGGTQWGEHKLFHEAGIFLLSANYKDILPLIAKILKAGYSNSRHKDTCIEILCTMAIKGNLDALEVLERNENNYDILKNLVPSALLKVYKKTTSKEVKAKTVSAIIRRFEVAATSHLHRNSGPCVFSEYENILALKKLPEIRVGYLSSISKIHESDLPMPGIATLILKINEIIPEKEMPEAKKILIKLAIDLGENSKRINPSSKEDYKRSSATIISAITKIIK